MQSQFIQTAFHRNVAVAIALVLAFWSISAIYHVQKANAAQLDVFSDTMSDTSPGGTSTHTIVFYTAAGIDGDTDIVITFDDEQNDSSNANDTPDKFDASGVGAGDVTVRHAATISFAGATTVTVDTVSGTNGTNGSPDTAATVTANLAGTGGTPIVPAGRYVEVVVSDVDNPSVGVSAPESYEISVSTDNGTTTDIGVTEVVIVPEITVLADVDEILQMTVTPLTTADSVNSDAITVGTAESGPGDIEALTATTVDYGILPTTGAEVGGHRIRVTTNASNGFQVAIVADQTLTSGGGDTIDEFDDGVAATTPTAWSAPAGTLGSPDTYGHWGISSEDADTNGSVAGGDNFTNGYVGNFIGTPRVFFGHDTPIDGITNGDAAGVTEIGYKVQITPYQEAGNDYTATLQMIATATF
jgi:hypothetical protein